MVQQTHVSWSTSSPPKQSNPTKFAEFHITSFGSDRYAGSRRGASPRVRKTTPTFVAIFVTENSGDGITYIAFTPQL